MPPTSIIASNEFHPIINIPNEILILVYLN